MKIGIGNWARPFASVWRVVVFTLVVCATTSAWANPQLLSYKSFDNIASSGGVSLTREAGSVDFTKIDGNYINYTTEADAKLGAHAYRANNGTIGLQNNSSGLVSVADGWTLSFWFHPNNQSNWNSFFGFGLLNGDNYFFVKTGTDAFSVYKDTTSTAESPLGTPALGSVAYTAASWNHVVLACAAGTGTVTLYVNGVSRGTFTVDSTTSLREVLLCCGRWHSGSDSAFYRDKQTTLFDDFALFDGVLSDTMIATIAAGRSTVTDIFTDYEENKTISISGDTTFTVDNDMAFETITVENTSGEAATLTFTGSYVINATQINVPANVTVKVDSAVSGTPVLNAPVVLSEATATLEIAAPATISKTISGSGKVVVSANAVTFATANTFAGGLTVADGGLAKSSNAAGYGSSATTVVVESGGTLDISGANSGGYKLSIVGTGVGDIGAVVNTGAALEYGGTLLNGLALTGAATVDCSNSWGVAGGKELLLSGNTLTITGASTSGKFYAHGIYHCAGSSQSDTSATAAIVVNGGTYYTANGNDKKGTLNLTIGADAKLYMSSNLTLDSVVVNGALEKRGGALTVASMQLDGTADINDQNKIACNGDLTIGADATATISNTSYISCAGTWTINGEVTVTATGTQNCNGNLVVGGTLNVNAGIFKVASTKLITKNGSGVINIASSGTVQWIDCSWSGANAGDIFRGDGTLFLDGNGGNWSYYPDPCAFPGTLKVVTRNGTSNYHEYYAYFSGDPSKFTARPKLLLACGTEAAPGSVQLGSPALGKTMSVRDLNGHAVIYPWASSSGTFTIDTLQRSDTSFNGIFVQYAPNQGISALTVRGETEATQTHSLTLTKASTTTGAATVRDNAKLIFSSTGSWANGTVTVANGGYLEVNNSDSVASTLDLQSGGTIVIQTVTTTTTTGEGDEAVEETTTSVVPIAAGTVTFPDSGEAVIDISAIPDLASKESVAIINATTSLDSDVSKIRLIGKPYSLKVDGNALKVVNDGGLVWDSAKGWGEKDATKYDEATITSPGTVALDGTSLAFDKLTLAGSGTVSFSRTGDETITVNNIVIGSGVTLDVSAALNISAGARITGDGTLNIPNGVTLTLDGVTCSARITAQNGGTLVTKGTKGATELSNENNNFAYGSLINVLTGKATVTAYKGSGYTTNDRGFHGNITIAKGATFVNSKTESFDCNADSSHPIVVDVYGTLSMGSTRWTLGNYNTIKLHEDATITGEGDSSSNGALDVENNVTTFKIIADGNATISANIRTRSKMLVEVSNGKNLTFSGSLISYGDGSIMEVVSGQVTTTTLPGFKVKIDEGATFTLKDAVWSGSDDKFSGTGTLELYSATASKEHTATGSTFAGIIKLSNVPVAGSNPPKWQNNINPSGSAMFDSSVRPEFVCDSTATHLGNGYYKSDSTKIEVRNLSGAGSLRAQWSSGSDCHYTIETKQTKATAFTGTIAAEDGDPKTGGGKYTRYINLSVIGDDSETPNSLTITQLQNTSSSDSSQALSTLTVSDNAKVIFSENGGWGYGHVIVGDDGYLECTNNAAVKKLTLNDGANIVFPTASSSLTGITSLTFASGTNYISFADGVTPTAGTLIDWSGASLESAPAGDFQLVGSVAGDWILTKSASGLSLAAAAAKVTPTTGNPVPYESVESALNDYAILLNTDEGATMTILDGTTLTEQEVMQLAQANIYYDSTSGVLMKAVAKVGQTCYPSLSAAISDGASVTLLRDSSEAITLNGESIVFSEGSSTFSGSFTGNGTLIMTVLPKSLATTLWSEGWTGTLWLKNITFPEIKSGADAGKSIVNPVVFGNANSTLRLTSCRGGFSDDYTYEEAEDKFPGTLDLVDENDTPAFTVTSGWPAYGKTVFAKLTGTGTLTSGNPSKAHYYQILDASEFRGTITIPSNDKFRVGIGSVDANLNNGSSIADRTLTIQTGASATIASGKTWSAANGGIVVNGTLNVAGTVTGGITSGNGLVNLTGGSVDLGTLGAAIMHKYVAVSGESSLTLQCEYNDGSGAIFNGDTIQSPFIKVESGATLNLSYGNFSGWNGDVCDGYVVNEGTLNISQKGTVSTFFRNHLIMTDGCTTHINGSAQLSLYGGPATEETAQIQLLSGTAELSADDGAGIGFGNVSNEGGYGGHGVGFNVGKDATLTVSAKIYQSNIDAGSNPIAKYGEGTLILSNLENSAAETWTLNAGAIKSVVELTVNSGDNSKQVRKIVNDGSYIYILSPAEVTATTFDFNSFTYGGLPVSLGEGDTIIVPSDCTGDEWNPNNLPNTAEHPVIVRKDMNWKAGIVTMTIDSGVTVYAYADYNSVINNGSEISGTGTLSLNGNVPVNGVASVLCTVGGSGKLSLANKNAILTVSSPLEDGKVITSVTGAKVISESVDGGTRYRVAYGTIFSVW